MSSEQFITMLLLLVLLMGTGVLGDVVVEISNGKVKGEVFITPFNESFYAFRGIPYAKPAIGDLRFQPPQEPDDWEGILDSDAKDRICIQLTSKLQPNESEDCLYIHVYTPQLPSENHPVSLPVMYVIHGGGFETGSPQEMGPDYLMHYNVVVVTVSYRLCFLGFLSTGDLNCPGNNGLKDQQLGLRWVQKNIRKFGGDPSKVTIFGESAGAVSVSYQMLAPSSKGLFVGAIQDSGSSLTNWALQVDPKYIAYKFARRINSTIRENNTSTLELMKFFKSLNVQQIKKASVDMFGEDFTVSLYNLIFGFSFSGVIEPEHEGAFLSKPPYQSFLTGDFNKVPTLLGVNSEECLLLAYDETFLKKMEYFDSNMEWYVSSNMNLTDLKTRKLVGREISEIYDASGALHNNEGLSIKYFSDSAFVRPTLKQAELQSNYTDVFFYEFGYSGEIGKYFPHSDVPGAEKVVHAEELLYLFRREGVKGINSYPEKDRITMHRMLTMWTNFVKFQNPTPRPLEILQNSSWPKIQSLDKIPFMLINDTLEVKYNLKQETMEKYQRIYEKYAIPPIVSY